MREDEYERQSEAADLHAPPKPGLARVLSGLSRRCRPRNFARATAMAGLLFVLEDAQAAHTFVLNLGLPALAVQVDVLVAALAAPEDQLDPIVGSSSSMWAAHLPP